MPRIAKGIVDHRQFRLGIVFVLLLSFADIGLKLLIAIFASFAVENIGDMRQFFFGVAGVLVSIGFSGFRRELHNVVVIRTTSKIFKPMHMEVFGSILKLGSTGDAVTNARDRMDKLHDIVLACGGYYIRLVLHVIFAIIAGTVFSWRLSLVYLVVCVVLFILFDVAGRFNLRNKANGHMPFGQKLFFIVIQTIALLGAWYMFYEWGAAGTVVSFIVVAAFFTRAIWEYRSMVFYMKEAIGVCRYLDKDVNYV